MHRTPTPPRTRRYQTRSAGRPAARPARQTFKSGDKHATEHFLDGTYLTPHTTEILSADRDDGVIQGACTDEEEEDHPIIDAYHQPEMEIEAHRQIEQGRQKIRSLTVLAILILGLPVIVTQLRFFLNPETPSYLSLGVNRWFILDWSSTSRAPRTCKATNMSDFMVEANLELDLLRERADIVQKQAQEKLRSIEQIFFEKQYVNRGDHQDLSDQLASVKAAAEKAASTIDGLESRMSTSNAKTEEMKHRLSQLNKLAEDLEGLQSVANRDLGHLATMAQLNVLEKELYTIKQQVGALSRTQHEQRGLTKSQIEALKAEQERLATQMSKLQDEMRRQSAYQKKIAIDAVTMDELQLRIDDLELEARKARDHRHKKFLTHDEAATLVDQKLSIYGADKIGRPDFALSATGARILKAEGQTSPGFTYAKRDINLIQRAKMLLGKQDHNAPERVIGGQDTLMGDCWAFSGGIGHVSIALARRVTIDAISIDHVHRTVAHHIGSAPRRFSLYMLPTKDAAAGKLIGGPFEFDVDTLHSVQSFPINPVQAQFVKFSILSNWGHEDYTCLYRVRVHGEAA